MLQRFSEDLSQLQRAIRWGDGDALFDLFTRTRAIRRSIVEQGQDDARADFGRTHESIASGSRRDLCRVADGDASRSMSVSPFGVSRLRTVCTRVCATRSGHVAHLADRAGPPRRTSRRAAQPIWPPRPRGWTAQRRRPSPAVPYAHRRIPPTNLASWDGTSRGSSAAPCGSSYLPCAAQPASGLACSRAPKSCSSALIAACTRASTSLARQPRRDRLAEADRDHPRVLRAALRQQPPAVERDRHHRQVQRLVQPREARLQRRLLAGRHARAFGIDDHRAAAPRCAALASRIIWRSALAEASRSTTIAP